MFSPLLFNMMYSIYEIGEGSVKWDTLGVDKQAGGFTMQFKKKCQKSWYGKLKER